jgi:glycerol-3-phosphate acyltransferase PlsX
VVGNNAISRPTRIGVDAMGGDNAPAAPVEAAVGAARALPDTQFVLVGQADVVQGQLARHTAPNVDIRHASQVVAMDEAPAAAVRAKPDSSIASALRLLQAGELQAVVTAGHTGAALAAALLHLGRIQGVRRPALATVYPTTTGGCVLLDIGANADVRPQYLLQFAVMGAAYATHILGRSNPRVGIVSIGEEPGKGSMEVQAAFDLLSASQLNFIGNIEGKDIPAGLADVVVTDGFTGNVIIKTSEGVAASIGRMLRQAMSAGISGQLAGLLLAPSLRVLRQRLDYRTYGGATLLGVDGVVIIAHGRSDATAIQNAIRVAVRAVDSGLIDAIRTGVA